MSNLTAITEFWLPQRKLGGYTLKFRLPQRLATNLAFNPKSFFWLNEESSNILNITDILNGGRKTQFEISKIWIVCFCPKIPLGEKQVLDSWRKKIDMERPFRPKNLETQTGLTQSKMCVSCVEFDRQRCQFL